MICSRIEEGLSRDIRASEAWCGTTAVSRHSTAMRCSKRVLTATLLTDALMEFLCEVDRLGKCRNGVFCLWRGPAEAECQPRLPVIISAHPKEPIDIQLTVRKTDRLTGLQGQE